MVAVNWLSGGVWLLGGVCILGLGYLIAFRGRADLHADFDETRDVDADVIGRRVGVVALFMGVVTVVHGLREIAFGFDPAALGLLLVVLLFCSYLTKLLARGWTPQQGFPER
ncbi:hypothetical protein [Halovivax gelatinilyticus]|uniref:hypothetical protein n=1 Tax=Halovivax gelatinilyticus TaxID=2961597 RepID=UPI0020CA6C5E|nr:hypothetical protein [Halovivax gelatinilyticus]